MSLERLNDHPPASSNGSRAALAQKPRAEWLLNRQRAVRLRRGELPALADFLRRLASEVAGGRSFTVCLVSDPVMRRYNRRFRALDKATDVLSFADEQPGRAGDLLISAPTARRQARLLGHSTGEEIRVLALHGLLHLLGHDHENSSEAALMARIERRWRRRFGLPAGLVERSGFRRPRARAAAHRP